MIIKATRLQAWTPAVGARVGRRPSPPPLENKKKVFWAILGAFLLRFSSYGGLFATFYFMVGAFFGACPPLRKFLRAPMIARRVRKDTCSPEIFLWDRDLVSSGHVLLRFCLKNDKNSDKL